MKSFPTLEIFNDINHEQYVSSNKLDKGFIYIALDKAFPDFCKIGRTQDLPKRIAQYNSDKPYPTTWIHTISQEFKNVTEVEEAILRYMYKITEPTTFKKEWFKVEFLDALLMCINEAEKRFELC